MQYWVVKNGDTYFRINKHSPIPPIVHKIVSHTLKIDLKMVKHTSEFLQQMRYFDQKIFIQFCVRWSIPFEIIIQEWTI